MQKEGLAISSTVSKENEFVVMLGGRLTTVTSMALDVYLTTALDDFDKDCLIFDLFDLTYISAQGLRLIFMTQKRLSEMHKSMKVINARDNVYATFDISGFANSMSVSGS